MKQKTTYLLVVSLFFVSLFSAYVAAPESANPSELTEFVSFDPPLLAETEEMDKDYWESMKPVKVYLAEQEELKKNELAKRRPRVSRKKTNVIGTPNIKRSTVRLSTDDLRARLIAACERYDITGSDRTWIVNAGIRIASRESGNSPGAVSPNGEYVGIYQFGSDWSSMENRLDADWSINRFVKVYKDGGQAKIYQHWRATI